jgi:hypothetical protein
VVEFNTNVTIPGLPVDGKGADPPNCSHGQQAARRTVMPRDSPNFGRVYYTCCTEAGKRRCSFFRWGDELDMYSPIRPRATLTAEEVRRNTSTVDAEAQLQAWEGVQQGTDTWLRLRSCRLTASNFGSVHRTNQFSSPSDLLRDLLWPSSFDSVAMRYGPAFVPRKGGGGREPVVGERKAGIGTPLRMDRTPGRSSGGMVR